MGVTSERRGKSEIGRFAMGKLVNPITLEEVNENLLKRLNELIESASADEILDITDSVAKLNASRKNSDQFARPETPEERMEREQREMFGSVLNGEEV